VKTLKDFDFNHKKVLLRCDFQVPLSLSKPEKVLDDFRIKETLPTITFLLENNAKLILMSHWKPEGSEKIVSLEIISHHLENLLKQRITFLKDCRGEKVKKRVEKMKEREIVFLENLRFYKEEEENDENFAKELASLGEIYINDAFGVCHRAHASVVGVPKFLPSAAGFLLEKEIRVLSQALENPFRPLVVLIGGAKIESKIRVIENFLRIADHLILGGKIANSILKGKGILVSEEILEKEVLLELEKIDLTNPKIHLPVDGVIALKDFPQNYKRIGAIGTVRKEENIFDIGPESRKLFKEIIKPAKMIIWSGPFGMFEDKNFAQGTKEIIEEMLANKDAFKIIGGGETIEAFKLFGSLERIDHVSTGGGAMLHFLAGEKLPGIEALK
jgi:3-phosphoglycerate kinase